jgi:hypothetical protein
MSSAMEAASAADTSSAPVSDLASAPAAAAAAPTPTTVPKPAPSAWSAAPATVRQAVSPKPLNLFQLSISPPRDGWTDENRVAVLTVVRSCQLATDTTRPQAKFGRKEAVIGLFSKEHALAAAAKAFVVHGETLTVSSDVKPPQPDATRVKVTGLPIGCTDALIRAAAAKHGIVRYVARDYIRGNNNRILADLDSAAVFFEPGSTPVRHYEVMGARCPVWDRRLPAQQPAAKRAKTDTGTITTSTGAPLLARSATQGNAATNMDSTNVPPAAELALSTAPPAADTQVTPASAAAAPATATDAHSTGPLAPAELDLDTSDPVQNDDGSYGTGTIIDMPDTTSTPTSPLDEFTPATQLNRKQRHNTHRNSRSPSPIRGRSSSPRRQRSPTPSSPTNN